ncbi:MAG: hypothetical protein SYR96_40425 [Actinomycetota bacterium]|nr:hypothetical protein [Actinomycetota bacterium]
MRTVGPRLIAVLSVLCSVAVGILTNVITERWSVTVAVALGVVVLVAAGLAWWDRRVVTSSGKATVEVTARRGSTIADSAVVAVGDSTVRAEADRGRIERARLDAERGDIHVRADRSTVNNVDLRSSGARAVDAESKDRPSGPGGAGGGG